MPRPSVPVILASTSPRRIELLSSVGLRVRVVAPDSDEKRLPGESPRHLVARLAEEKASSVVSLTLKSRAAAYIIAADTIVLAPVRAKVLGKPRSRREARAMLRMLSGKTHTVLTGYCILSVARGSRPRRLVRLVQSRVSMRKLTDADIRSYVATGEPMDKAGSYAAQGLGMALIESIRGSYTNVVGLPVCQVIWDLERRFGLPLFNRKGR